MERVQAVDAALERVASRMTPMIRNRAIDAGWPEDVANSLSMVRNANGVGVNVGKAARQKAEDLEFGSATSAPRSVFTSFNTPQMKKQVEEIARNSMDELLDQMRGVFK